MSVCVCVFIFNVLRIWLAGVSEQKYVNVGVCVFAWEGFDKLLLLFTESLPPPHLKVAYAGI